MTTAPSPAIVPQLPRRRGTIACPTCGHALPWLSPRMSWYHRWRARLTLAVHRDGACLPPSGGDSA